MATGVQWVHMWGGGGGENSMNGLENNMSSQEMENCFSCSDMHLSVILQLKFWNHAGYAIWPQE